jgi:threonine/homoserine/homoserine lactone efflux protein
MVDLWTTLLPLVIGSAVVPTQIVVTSVLLRSSRGKAAAWIAGMAGLRVLQGVLFGLVFAEVRSHATPLGGPRILAGGLLLAIAVLFYATALRQAIAGDAAAAEASPQWLSRVESMPGVAAFGAGAAYVALSPEKWVFTLTAIGAIADAALGPWASVLTFAAFVALTVSTGLAVFGFATLDPERAAAVSARVRRWFERRARILTAALGAVFGTWFLLKALSALGLA